MQSLNPAMAGLSLEVSPVVWSRSALGTPAPRSQLGQNFAGAPTTAQVHIRWGRILLDVVQTLGGTGPLYTREDSMDGPFRSRVSFRLPLDSAGTVFKDFAVIGTKCSTLYEAESEAAAAALQGLQHGRLHMCVKDVSRTRCRELEKRCYQILGGASEMYHSVKSLLSDWENDMNKAELCYSPGRELAASSSCPKTYKTHGEMSPDVADQLANIIMAHYLKLKELELETEGVKILIEQVRERVAYFFQEPSLHQVNKYRGSLPCEVELDMKLVLQEMMMSIGWEWPSFTVIPSGIGLYVCETIISPNNVHLGLAPKPLTVTGAHASSKEQAVKNCCEAAILSLETERSICLVDLNYNSRSHGELYIFESNETVQSASFVGSKVLGQWQEMVAEIHICEEYCQKLVLEHAEEGEGNLLHRMKYATVKAVSGLHAECVADLQTAKQGFTYGHI